MGRVTVLVLGWLSGACAVLGAALIYWGALMIDVPPGGLFILLGLASVVASIILAAWGAWKVSKP